MNITGDMTVIGSITGSLWNDYPTYTDAAQTTVDLGAEYSSTCLGGYDGDEIDLR